MSDDGTVHLKVDGAVAAIVFDRPAALNAMTWAMYEQLVAHCQRLGGDPNVRVVTMRGAGGAAFVAGTDIAQFRSFGSGASGGDDGIAYEARIDGCIGAIAALPMPTLAIVEGWCVGGGLAIATACDFRLATPDARFAVPIAKTVGNCLSMANLARLSTALGTQRLRRMLLLAETLSADEALACGYLQQTAAATEMDSAAATLCDGLARFSPVTQSVSKEGLRRLALENLPNGDDLVRLAYSSADFRAAVEAFVARKPPPWSRCTPVPPVQQWTKNALSTTGTT